MSATTMSRTRALPKGNDLLVTLSAWVLGLLWILPLLYAVWAAIHPAAYATHFSLLAPLTGHNFVVAWQAAPFPRYLLNTFLLVTMVLGPEAEQANRGARNRVARCTSLTM
jgi:sn-glycerol 3-phosphate transport system permease protein